jgi:hypothetical protein
MPASEFLISCAISAARWWASPPPPRSDGGLEVVVFAIDDECP